MAREAVNDENATDVLERRVWRIRSGSYTLHVLYDETTGRLVTCFPPPFAPLSDQAPPPPARTWCDFGYKRSRHKRRAAAA